MNETIKKEEVKITDLIYEINGSQVILDSDLAKLYETETKRINEAVSRNKERFPDRFSWILTEEEMKIFLVAICDQKIEKRGGRYKNARVFTEQGVAMLATILRSPIAIKASIQIMDAFVAMRKYISSNLIEQRYINHMVLEHDSKIKLLQESFDKFDEKRKVNEIYFDGQIYDAYSKIQEIVNDAKKDLIIIDNYADHTILDIVKRLHVDVTIVTRKNNLLTEQDILKYRKQYHNLNVIYDNTFHDRYFILDHNVIYHCGASINRIGYKTFSITLIGDNEMAQTLMNKIKCMITKS